jgi:hypothetical protein
VSAGICSSKTAQLAQTLQTYTTRQLKQWSPFSYTPHFILRTPLFFTALFSGTNSFPSIIVFCFTTPSHMQ